MGTVTVPIEVGNPGGSQWLPFDAAVDTGAFLTAIPKSAWDALGLTPRARRSFLLAHGRRAEYDIAEARVRINGEDETTLVVSTENEIAPLLGAYTLEAFFWGVDPVHQRLVPVEGWLL